MCLTGVPRARDLRYDTAINSLARASEPHDIHFKMVKRIMYDVGMIGSEGIGAMNAMDLLLMIG